jgi:hypothetical protein
MNPFMRTIVAIAVLALVPTAALAQTQAQQKPTEAQIREAAALQRAQLQSDRQAVVAANLPLSGEQAAAFWPIYREYRNALALAGDRLTNLILAYSKNYESMTDQQATPMLDEWLAIKQQEMKIKIDYASKFRQVLPSKLVTRFYQIENKLDTIVMLDMVTGIPLVK